MVKEKFEEGTFGSDFSFLNEYKPKKEEDKGFVPFKGTYDCVVNHARIEDYQGDKPEFKGVKFFRYELEVGEGQENQGRRLWASFNLSDEKKVKKLADRLWTITGMEFKNLEELQKIADEFVKHTITVKAWTFKPEDSEDVIQLHSVKGNASAEIKKKDEETPF